uniref:Uncharacterized protein n=1 Tax=Arcella intermedia TaxID=1963864 RepID=A0A6B2LKX6_9EUKA
MLIMGDCGVGKTSLLLRFMQNTFVEVSITNSYKLEVKVIDVGGSPVKLQILDGVHLERWRTSPISPHRGTTGYLVLYDVTNTESFINVEKWIAEIALYSCEDVIRLLVGTKCDLEEERKVSTKDGQLLAEKFNMRFIETSAKDSTNVEEAFFQLAADLKEQQDDTKRFLL